VLIGFVRPFDHSTIGEITGEAKFAGSGEVQTVSGVKLKLDLDDFTDIRLGQGRRLEKVA
jgi:anaphase-promoting complex subunit 1